VNINIPICCCYTLFHANVEREENENVKKEKLMNK
jgi:hypothetical protein